MQLHDPDLLRTRCLIGGEWVAAEDGSSFPVHNPADGALLAQVPNMGASEARKAIAAAHASWPGWRARTAHDRAAVLRRWFELVMQHQADLAALMTAEQGKPLAEAKGEIAYAASFLEWFAEEAKRVYGEVASHPQADKRIVVLREPVGVCAAITPWNFPAAMITRKVAPALAAGCTMIVKPAGQTPLSALALAVLAERAGVPAGVLNVLTGASAAIGGELTRSPLVRKLSFTGSTEVGRLLMRQCADTLKRLSLELGGNAPFIVFEDADLDAAVAGAIASKYRNSGQTCVCANRFLVHEKVYDEFAAKLTRQVRALKVGNGVGEGIVQGPLIDAAAVAKVEAHIADAVARGARVVAGGRRHALGGTFFEPTVIVDVPATALLASAETFGPGAALFRFRDDAEAVRLANASEYGLAAYFFSRDLSRVWRVAEALECGMVGVNTGAISNEVAPFGGVKQSGFGREGSRYGMQEYQSIKYLCLGGIQ